MNKNCYIISFEINSGTNTLELLNAIKKYGTWAKITDTTWAVVTLDRSSMIRDNLSRFIKSTDRIFVLKSGFEAAWLNVHCNNDWLKGNL